MKIQYYWELDVYKLAREGRKRIFELSKGFPREELGMVHFAQKSR